MRIDVAALTQLPDDFAGWLSDGESVSQESTIFTVAHCDQIPAGLLTMDLEPPRATVTFHFVQPELRDLGVGEALLEAALLRAKQAGCTSCTAWVPTGDRIAKLTYEALGFRSDLIRVTRTL